MCKSVSQALRVYTEEERKLIYAIKDEQETCFYCKKHLERGERTLDHIQPLNRGGKTVRENLVVACDKCNSEKNDMTLVEYMKFLQKKDSIKNDKNNELQKIENTIINTNFTIKMLKSELAEYMDIERKIRNIKSKINHFENLRSVQNSYKEIIINQFDLQEKMLNTDVNETLGRLHLKEDLFEEIMNKEYVNMVSEDIEVDEITQKVTEDVIKNIKGSKVVEVNIDELIYDEDSYNVKTKTRKVIKLMSLYNKHNSFLDDGLIEVRKLDNGKYFVVDKYCQLVACNNLGIKNIKVLVIC